MASSVPAPFLRATRPPKILCLIFKYLGDVAVAVPALRALKECRPDAELHVLVAEDALPIVLHLPWISHAWGFPRKRGTAQLRRSWKVIRALRAERFDASVDFEGNDRGALVTLAIGAPERLGPVAPKGFFGRRHCYTTFLDRYPQHIIEGAQARRLLYVLSPWGVPPPSTLALEVHADPALRPAAETILPDAPVICHLSTSQTKKEWPTERWAALGALLTQNGVPFVFASGPSPREQALLDPLRNAPGLAPTRILPPVTDLATYLAVLERARAFVSGDTGPLHFAAGLGVPTVSLFGPSPAALWAPSGPQHRHLCARDCPCPKHLSACEQPIPCMAQIGPNEVWDALKAVLPPSSPADTANAAQA